MSAAGLGLRLHDTLYGSDYNRVFQNWWEYAKEHYIPIHGGEVVGSISMYYDPILGIHMPGDHEAFQKFGIAQLIQASRPDDARVLAEAAFDQLGWREGAPIETPGGNPREVIYGMIYAREYGDEGLYGKLKAYAEEHFEPTWDDASGEFWWGFGLNEPHPRGQFNAIAALAETVTEGAWGRLLGEPNLRKFVEPTVTGVDFPKVCLSQAVYDVDRRCLIVATDKGAPGAAGEPTSFRITNVHPDNCTVVADGVVSDDWRAVHGDIEVSTTVGEHTFVVRMH
ncbi:MAG: hypothetical protein OXC14_17445 [Rhodospirillaceae bacterium]|nr:hypothetical protein [Rhodospirillaceae bacterium]